MTAIAHWLSYQAATHGHRLALQAGQERWSYAELHASAAILARRLASCGLRPGDRLALLLPNGPDFVQLAHAASLLGAVLVPLNIRLAIPELAWQLQHAGARAVVACDATADLALAAARGLQGVEVWEAAELHRRQPAETALRESLDLEAVYTVLYTSGTTGRPKGAMLTYGNHWWNAVGSALHLDLRPDDRWLACMPLFHVGGLAILVRAAVCGFPVVVHERFDPEAANRAIDEEGITLVSVVATMLARMLDARGSRPYPPSLRAVVVGGGPVPAELLERCARIGLPALPTYGLTEASSQVTTLPPAEAGTRRGCSGKPLPVVRVRIEADGEAAPPGTPGEILVRGPTVTPGYLRDPQATRRALAGGWLHTGDIGYVEPDGYLYVLDRRDDLIVSGGENVYPAEVEAVLTAHPAVEEAAVTGRSDAEWGQVPVAAVRLRAGYHATEAELLEFCRARLAGFKVPRQIRFMDALPRNAAGKLLRRSLREALSLPK